MRGKKLRISNEDEAGEETIGLAGEAIYIRLSVIFRLF